MNRDMNGAKHSPAQDSVPAALFDIHQRLLEDGEAWRDDLPLGATQALQETGPQRSVNERNETTEWNGHLAALAQPSNMPRRDVSWGRRLIASAAILVVVGLLGALFATFAHSRNDTHLTSGGYNSSPTAMAPANTPGPAAKYVVMVVTARAVDSNLTPIDVTSHFPVGSQVHLVIQVRNLTAGEKHTVSVRWFLNGTDMNVNGGPGRTSVEVTDNSNAHLALVYTAPGVGMAKVYWDRPANDNSDTENDPSLAQTIYFSIEQPTPSA